MESLAVLEMAFGDKAAVAFATLGLEEAGPVPSSKGDLQAQEGAAALALTATFPYRVQNASVASWGGLQQETLLLS